MNTKQDLATPFASLLFTSAEGDLSKIRGLHKILAGSDTQEVDEMAKELQVKLVIYKEKLLRSREDQNG